MRSFGQYCLECTVLKFLPLLKGLLKRRLIVPFLCRTSSLMALPGDLIFWLCITSPHRRATRTWLEWSASPNTEKMSRRHQREVAKPEIQRSSNIRFRKNSTKFCHACPTSVPALNYPEEHLPKWHFGARQLVAEIAGIWWISSEGGEINLQAMSWRDCKTISWQKASSVKRKFQTLLCIQISSTWTPCPLSVGKSLSTRAK